MSCSEPRSTAPAAGSGDGGRIISVNITERHDPLAGVRACLERMPEADRTHVRVWLSSTRGEPVLCLGVKQRPYHHRRIALRREADRWGLAERDLLQAARDVQRQNREAIRRMFPRDGGERDQVPGGEREWAGLIDQPGLVPVPGSRHCVIADGPPDVRVQPDPERPGRILLSASIEAGDLPEWVRMLRHEAGKNATGLGGLRSDPAQSAGADSWQPTR